jgi:hypothetical protein
VLQIAGLSAGLDGEASLATNLHIDSGKADDAVIVLDSTLDRFFANLGRGFDNLAVSVLIDPRIIASDANEFPKLPELVNRGRRALA